MNTLSPYLLLSFFVGICPTEASLRSAYYNAGGVVVWTVGGGGGRGGLWRVRGGRGWAWEVGMGVWGGGGR